MLGTYKEKLNSVTYVVTRISMLKSKNIDF